MVRKPKFGSWSDDTKQQVHEMLDHFILAAEKGENSMREMYRIQPLGWIAQNAVYWKNVVSGLRWVKFLIPQLREKENGDEQGSKNPDRREESSGDSEAIEWIDNGTGTVDRS